MARDDERDKGQAKYDLEPAALSEMRGPKSWSAGTELADRQTEKYRGLQGVAEFFRDNPQEIPEQKGQSPEDWRKESEAKVAEAMALAFHDKTIAAMFPKTPKWEQLGTAERLEIANLCEYLVSKVENREKCQVIEADLRENPTRSDYRHEESKILLNSATVLNQKSAEGDKFDFMVELAYAQCLANDIVESSRKDESPYLGPSDKDLIQANRLNYHGRGETDADYERHVNQPLVARQTSRSYERVHKADELLQRQSD